MKKQKTNESSKRKKERILFKTGTWKKNYQKRKWGKEKENKKCLLNIKIRKRILVDFNMRRNGQNNEK